MTQIEKAAFYAKKKFLSTFISVLHTEKPFLCISFHALRCKTNIKKDVFFYIRILTSGAKKTSFCVTAFQMRIFFTFPHIKRLFFEISTEKPRRAHFSTLLLFHEKASIRDFPIPGGFYSQEGTVVPLTQLRLSSRFLEASASFVSGVT